MNKDKNSANLWQKFASTYKQEKHRENNLDADLYCYEHIETPGTNVNEWIIERKRVQPFFQLISKTPFFLAQKEPFDQELRSFLELIKIFLLITKA